MLAQMGPTIYSSLICERLMLEVLVFHIRYSTVVTILHYITTLLYKFLGPFVPSHLAIIRNKVIGINLFAEVANASLIIT